MTCDSHSCATAFCYLWGAWLLAQKTEGIDDRQLESERGTIRKLYHWQDRARMCSCFMYHSRKPELFFLVLKDSEACVHPLRLLEHAHEVGLQLFVKNKPLRATKVISTHEIDRKRISGYRVCCSCGIDSEPIVEWTVVSLAYERTVYRIDVIKPLSDSPVMLSDVILNLENTAEVSETGVDRYAGHGLDDIVIRFLANPFSLALSAQLPSGMCRFTNARKGQRVADTVQMTTAWAVGRNISDIDHTHLLGIHDL